MGLIDNPNPAIAEVKVSPTLSLNISRPLGTVRSIVRCASVLSRYLSTAILSQIRVVRPNSLTDRWGECYEKKEVAPRDRIELPAP
jgi:hypothetical protein